MSGSLLFITNAIPPRTTITSTIDDEFTQPSFHPKSVKAHPAKKDPELQLLLKFEKDVRVRILEHCDPFTLVAFCTYPTVKDKICEEFRNPNRDKTKSEQILLNFDDSKAQIAIIRPEWPDTIWCFNVKNQITLGSYEIHSSLKLNTWISSKQITEDPFIMRTLKTETLDVITNDVIGAALYIFDIFCQVYNNPLCRANCHWLDGEILDQDKMLSIFDRNVINHYGLFHMSPTKFSIGSVLSQSIVHSAKSLHIYPLGDTSQEYLPIVKAMELEYFVDFYAHTFEVDDIFNMQCKYFCLYNTKFKTLDLRTIVDEWINGCSPKWKALLITNGKIWISAPKIWPVSDICTAFDGLVTGYSSLENARLLNVPNVSDVSCVKFESRHRIGYHITRKAETKQEETAEVYFEKYANEPYFFHFIIGMDRNRKTQIALEKWFQERNKDNEVLRCNLMMAKGLH